MIYLTTYKPESRKTDREREHRLGRLLLKAALRREYGRVWEVEEGPGGRPRLKAGAEEAAGAVAGAEGAAGAEAHARAVQYPPDFNISHTTGLVVCAVSARRVGVDAQIILPRRQALVRRVLAETEQELLVRTEQSEGEQAADELFTRLWTLKESYVKATGDGLAYPLKQAVFIRDGAGRWQGNTPGYAYHQVRVYRRYIVTVCLKKEKGVRG